MCESHFKILCMLNSSDEDEETQGKCQTHVEMDIVDDLAKQLPSDPR